MRIRELNFIQKILGIGIIVPILLSVALFGANPVRIMPLGDSITQGNHVPNEAANLSIGYRGSLWTQFADGGYNVDFVGSQTAGSDYLTTDPTFDLDHEGHSGWRADEIDDEVSNFLNATQADAVLLHIGTNDLDQGEDILSTVTDVENILDKINAYNSSTKVIIARIINQETNDPDTTTFNTELNTKVQQRISNGDNITIVDMENGAGIDYAADMVDNLHPNEIGYAKMADLWYSALSSVLTPIVPVNLWKLDEPADSITYIDFYAGADGTCIDPGCPVPILGQVNGAQIFDGNDEINVIDASAFDWAADANITIEFWMKKSFSSLKPNENEVIIGRKGELDSTFTDIWYVGVEWETGTVAYGLGNRAGGIQFTNGTKKVANGNWNHIAYVITGDNIKIYVNGQKDVDVNRTKPGEHIQGTPVNIGYLNWGITYEYIGQLDELTVYDAELSAGLIQQHYENGFKPHLVEVTAVPTLTNVNTPDYTFSSDKNGTITYSGSCDSATTTATEGNNTITFNTLIDGTYSDCMITVTAIDGNVSEALAVTEFVVDTTAPVITLTGATTINLLLGETYTELGAACTDNYDVTCTVVIGGDSVDTSTAGNYIVTYNATDASGNTATQVTRTVSVAEVAADNSSGSGGGCTYNSHSKNFDMSFLLMIALGLLYPFRRRFLK